MNFKNVRNSYIIILLVGIGIILFTLNSSNPNTEFLVRAIQIFLFLLTVAFIFLLTRGAIHIQKNFFIHSINHLHGQQNKICLTFDDGIDAELTPQVLDILKEQNVNALFFIIGKTIQGNEDILKRIQNEGHIVGNHSFSHSFWYDLQFSSDMLKDILRTNELIVNASGKKNNPIYFRPPYGVTNPALAKAIRKSKMISVGWSLRSMDTLAKSKDELLEKLIRQTKAGDIVLLHDRCKITVDTLTDYITFCKNQGYTFTTIL